MQVNGEPSRAGPPRVDAFWIELSAAWRRDRVVAEVGTASANNIVLARQLRTARLQLLRLLVTHDLAGVIGLCTEQGLDVAGVACTARAASEPDQARAAGRNGPILGAPAGSHQPRPAELSNLAAALEGKLAPHQLELLAKNFVETYRAHEGRGEVQHALTRCERLLTRMTTANRRLVLFVIKKFFAQAQLPEEDLIQEGCIGLCRAIERFDPERGFKFSTYGVWWIRQQIARYIDDNAGLIRLPVHHAELLPRVRAAEGRMRARGEDPTDQNIARMLAVPTDTLRLVRETHSANASITHIDETGGAIVAGAVGEPYAQAVRAEERRFIEDLLHGLTEKEATVIRRRFGIGCDEETLEAVGDDFGVSRERIRQIEANALERLTKRARRDPRAGGLNLHQAKSLPDAVRR